MSVLPSGRHFFRGEPGYESARCAAVWNGRTPVRYPAVIVQADTADEVAAAVRYAEVHGHKIGIRSGGHSWTGNHVRDGGLLLDVSRLNRYTVDEQRRVAVVGPGTHGHTLAIELADRGLFFPTGHVRGVGIGGYLLQGGFGWNGRMLGPACQSIIGVDVVTASGEQIHIDADNEPDLYWAARGSGPGFFAVATAFHLRLSERPAVCGHGLQVYSTDYADEIFTWARSLDIDPRMEFYVKAAAPNPAVGLDSPYIAIWTPVFAESDHAAAAALSVVESCPVRDKAIVATGFTPTDLDALYEFTSADFPSGCRCAVDGMWTSAPAEELLPGVHRILDTIPPHPAHLLWMNWGPQPPRHDMAFTLEDDIYIALNAVWTQVSDDARCADWTRSNMAAMAGSSTGIQLADENLAARPAPFATVETMAKLDRVRSHYDPDNRFHSWMGRI